MNIQQAIGLYFLESFAFALAVWMINKLQTLKDRLWGWLA